jgi:hypothetical protein
VKDQIREVKKNSTQNSCRIFSASPKPLIGALLRTLLQVLKAIKHSQQAEYKIIFKLKF